MTVVSGYITEAGKKVSGETQGTGTVGQGSQHSTAPSEKTSTTNENENIKKTLEEENTFDGGHALSDTANNVVGKEIEGRKGVAVPESVVPDTSGLGAENSFSSKEENVVDDQSKGNKSDATDTADTDNALQALNKVLIPSAVSDLPPHAQNDMGSGKGSESYTNNIDNPRTETLKIDTKEYAVEQSEVKKDEKEGNNAELKRENKQPSKNAPIFDTSDEGIKVGDVVRKEGDTNATGN